MGILQSTLGDYGHVHYMNTDDLLHFYIEQVSLSQKMQWAGVMQQQAASAAIGGGLNQSLNQYTMMTGFWQTINHYIHVLGFGFIPLALAGVVTCIAIKASVVVFFISVFLLMFFLTHALTYRTQWGQRKAIYGTLPSVSILAAIFLSAGATGAYLGFYLTPASEKLQIKVLE